MTGSDPAAPPETTRRAAPRRPLLVGVLAYATPILTRLALAAGLLLALFTGTPSVQAQTTPRGCAPGQDPGFTAQFEPLVERIGPALGTPFTCAYPDPAGTGDVHILTDRGLAYWRKSTDTLSYTSVSHFDGQQHLALVGDQTLGWQGTSVDPPADALDLTPCRDNDTFKDELSDLYPYVWSGYVKYLGVFDGQMIIGCHAWQQTYTNQIYCYLRAGQPVAIEGYPRPCADSFFQDDDGTIRHLGKTGYLDGYFERLRWIGTGFELIESFRSCWSSPLPIPDDMPFEQISAYCGYKG